MKVLVTGAAGFVGAALCRDLLKRGDEVLGVDNFTPYYDVSLKEARVETLKNFEDFEFQRLDIADTEKFNEAYKKFQPEVVANMAAQPGVRYSLENPMAYINSNVIGFTNILEACRHYGVKHLVYASSSSVYGANTTMPYSVHHGANHPLSLYAATKKSNEMMAHSYASLFKIPCTGLRFFTVYGPWGRPDMAVFGFTHKIVNNQPIDVFNQGKHHRDFTYIDDIIEGVVRVIDQPAVQNPIWSSKSPDPATSSAPYRIYNIGNHQPVLLGDFIETLESVIGKKAEKVFKELQPGDVPDTFADHEDLKLDFDYSPNTDLKTGLTQFWQWYQEYFKL